MFYTDDQTLGDLAGLLKQDANALPSWWSSVNTGAHAWGYSQVVSILASRGYTLAQITSSEQAPEWERELTLWANITRSGSTEAFSSAMLAALDCRAAMKEASLTASGVFLDPAGTAGLPSAGQESTGGDMFVQDWDDSRRGEETRW